MFYDCDLIIDGALDETKNLDNHGRGLYVEELLIDSGKNQWEGELFVYPEGQNGGEFAGSTRVYEFDNGMLNERVV